MYSKPHIQEANTPWSAIKNNWLIVLVNKFVHSRFEPSGFTNNPNIRIAKSIVDYIFRWLAIKFLPPEDLLYVGLNDVTSLTNGNGHGNGQSPLEKMSKLAGETVKEKDDDEENVIYRQTALDLSAAAEKNTFDMQSDAPVCGTCGSMMIRSGSCYKCFNCGSTSGCS